MGRKPQSDLFTFQMRSLDPEWGGHPYLANLNQRGGQTWVPAPTPNRFYKSQGQCVKWSVCSPPSSPIKMWRWDGAMRAAPAQWPQDICVNVKGKGKERKRVRDVVMGTPRQTTRWKRFETHSATSGFIYSNNKSRHLCQNQCSVKQTKDKLLNLINTVF